MHKIILFVLAMSLSQNLFAQISFSDTTLNLPRVNKLLVADLNQDKFSDIIAQCSNELYIFIWQKNFKQKPDQILRLPQNTALWCLSAGHDVLAMSSKGVIAYSLNQGRYNEQAQEIITYPTIFEAEAAVSNPLYLNFVADLDNNAHNDIMIPAQDGLLLFYEKEGEYVLKQKIALDLEPSLIVPMSPLAKVTQYLQIPLIEASDLDGNGRCDIVTYSYGVINVFIQDDSGLFTKSVTKEAPTKRKAKRDKPRFHFDLPPKFIDINSDKLTDLLLADPYKGKIEIYFSRKKKLDFSVPDVFKQIGDAWLVGTDLVDFDNDGLKDLVLWLTRKFGIVGGLKIFIGKTISLELLFYKQEKPDVFSAEPVQAIELDVPFTLRVSKESIGGKLKFEPLFGGDINADKLSDVVILDMQDNQILVYLGEKDNLVNEDASTKITLDIPADAQLSWSGLEDINNDGKSDILIVYDTSKGSMLQIKTAK